MNPEAFGASKPSRHNYFALKIMSPYNFKPGVSFAYKSGGSGQLNYLRSRSADFESITNQHINNQINVAVNLNLFNTIKTSLNKQIFSSSNEVLVTSAWGALWPRAWREVAGKSLLFPRGNMTDYEWYLQNSRLKEILKMQSYFVSLLDRNQRKKRGVNSFLPLLYDDDTVHYFSAAILEKITGYINKLETIYAANRQIQAPEIGYIKRDQQYYPTFHYAPQNQISERKEADIKWENRSQTSLNIQKNLKLEENKNYAYEKLDSKVIYNNLNFENIMDKVYKSIETRLKFESLKKGLR